MIRQAPLGHNRSAARNDAGGAVGGQRNVRQTHARMNGPVIDTLFGLLNKRVAEHFPCEVFGDAVHFFKRLINRHRADGNGAVADDPFADVVDIGSGGKVHDRVGAPADRPHHLVDFFTDR